MLPLVGSMITVSCGDLAVAFGGVDHRHADAVFDDHSGLKFSSFATTVATQPSASRFNLTSGVLPMQRVMSCRTPFGNAAVAM